MKCQDCKTWVPQSSDNKTGWCISLKIARNFNEFDKTSIMCQCEQIRTNMDDTFLITGELFGCVNFISRV